MNTYGLEGRSVDRLLSLKKLADVSKEQYLNSVRQFLTFTHQAPDEMVRNVKAKPREFEKQFKALMEKKTNEASASTAALIRNSTKKFLDVNGVTNVNWADIDDAIPERKRYGEDRAPTAEEIRRMVNAADLRLKCVILYLCSSGARIGSIPTLKWRDMAEVKAEGQTFAKVTVYRGDKDQYDTFVTPEAYEQLQEYRHYRENVGEDVGPQSPVFVTSLNVDDFKPDRVRPLATDTVKLLLARLQRQLGLREVLSEGQNSRRMVFKTGHGFRKFFKTRMEVAGVNRLATEMMMGHNIGVQASYNKPTEPEMAKEYAKAIGELTIVGKKEEKVDVKSQLKTQLLLVAGFDEKEIAKLDLAKTTDEEFKRMVRERLLGVMANNGNRQKVVPISQVREFITQGWEYVAQLPDSEAVIKLPQ